MGAEAGAIRVGVAGWDYPDWKGIVYPSFANRQFDRLSWITRFVDLIEVNTSFYHPLAPRVAASWVRRTEDRPGIRFSAKSHRSWSHEGECDAAEVVPPTLRGLQPLLDAGRLGALLIQFPQSFHFTPASLERIERLAERLRDWPVVVEVRHVSWEADEVEAWFRDRAIGWCAVDQPRVGSSTARPLPRVTSPVGYMRLHGRNTRDWFRPEAGRDARYDYLYTTDELQDVADAARRMSGSARELLVVQNNHFRGQALVNALQLKQLIEQRAPLAPEELVATYPELAGTVCVERHRLF